MTGEKLNNGTAVALGNFDGMHIGHSAVLDKTIELSKKDLTPTVMLFDEHSLKAVKGEAPPMIMTEEERLSFLKSKGLSAVTVNFTEIKDYTPTEFVECILKDKLNARAVVCGFNYRFGKGAAGDASLLGTLCESNGIECVVIEEVFSDSLPVNSTAIRKAIENGDIARANKMLGRRFSFTATVIDGDKRGRTWGFPTINQRLPDGMVTPRFGVYKSAVKIGREYYTGVTNIGYRPTVGTDTVLCETHILGFSGDLYGRNIEISLIDFIRPEKKFSSFDELVSQIKSDCILVKGGVTEDV